MSRIAVEASSSSGRRRPADSSTSRVRPSVTANSCQPPRDALQFVLTTVLEGEVRAGREINRLGRGACLNEDRSQSPGRAAAGPPPHPQGAQHQGAEEHDDADEQQEQQAFRDHTHDAQHDRRDHQQ